MNSRIDIHYLLENPGLAELSREQHFLFQATSYKKSPWLPASTKAIPESIALHNIITTEEPLLDEAGKPVKHEEEIIRHGAINFDFDDKDNPEKAVLEMATATKMLVESYGVDPTGITAYISGGKGAGLIVDSRCIGEEYLKGHPRLADFQKSIATALASSFSTVDLSIYSKKRGRMNRRLNAQRDNGNYRALVSLADLVLPEKELLERSKAAGPKLQFPEVIKKSPRLSEEFSRFLKQDRLGSKAVGVLVKASNLPEKATPATMFPEIVPDIPCLEELNECDPEKISQEKTFHDLSYLAARQLSDRDAQSSAAALRPFIKRWESGSYPTEDDRVKHLHEQLAATQALREGRACKAMRKALPRLNCIGCQHFSDSVEAMGSTLVFEDGILERRGTDPKGLPTSLFLANFHLSLETRKTVTAPDRAGGDAVLTFKISFVDGAYFAEIPAKDLLRKDDFTSKISNACGGRAQINPQLWSLVVAFATSRHPKKNALSYKTTGWYSKRLFITDRLKIEQGKIIETSESLLAVAEEAFAQKIIFRAIDKAALRKILAEWLPRLLKMAAKGQVSVILGFEVSSIVDGFLEILHRYFLNLSGPSGIGKSVLVKATYLLFSDAFAENGIITAAATPMSIEANGFFLKDLPFVIDDVKVANISNMAQFRRVLQNGCDATGRARLAADGTLQKTLFMRGRAFLNGEDSVLGNEPSLAGRSIELPAEKVADFSAELAFLVDHQHEIQGIVPHFVAYLQSEVNKVEITSKVNAIKLKFKEKLIAGENRDRVIQSITSIFSSLHIFYGWIKREVPEMAQLLADEVRTAEILLVALGNQQIKTATAMVPSQTFLSAVADGIMSDKAILGKLAEGYDPMNNSHGKPIVGFVHEDNNEIVYLLPSVSLGLAREVYARAGTSLDFSLKAIAQSLKEGGHIAKANAGTITYKVRVKFGTADTWAVKRTSLFPEEKP